ncbi:hypothetical protein OK006_9522 [Actinobacteria bacterium OK006]|nr:hypothetical protein OK006_9522 [Actinobacteria bacterium OK006]
MAGRPGPCCRFPPGWRGGTGYRGKSAGRLAHYLAAALPSFSPPPPGCWPCSARSAPTPALTSGCPESCCAVCGCAAAGGGGKNWSTLAGSAERPAGSRTWRHSSLMPQSSLGDQDVVCKPAPPMGLCARPLALPSGWAPAVQLTAVVLATYTSGAAGSTGIEVPTRLCGHSPHQAGELLDRLVASRSLVPGTTAGIPTKSPGACFSRSEWAARRFSSDSTTVSNCVTCRASAGCSPCTGERGITRQEHPVALVRTTSKLPHAAAVVSCG